MADYPIPTQLVVDERLVPAANAQVTVYDLNDTNNTTPLALKDMNGTPIANPITTTANALSPNILAPVPKVKFVAPSTGLSIPVVSTDGLEAAAQAAADDANAAKAFVQGITVSAAPGPEAAAAIDSNGKISFTIPQGPKGADGSNVLPTDEAVAQAVMSTTSSTHAAINSRVDLRASEQVPPLVEAAIASDSTIAAAGAAAAEGAVDDALNTSTRIPKIVDATKVEAKWRSRLGRRLLARLLDNGVFQSSGVQMIGDGGVTRAFTRTDYLRGTRIRVAGRAHPVLAQDALLADGRIPQRTLDEWSSRMSAPRSPKGRGIICRGDSLTAGAFGDGVSYPQYLSVLAPGLPIAKRGNPGERSKEISMRQGSTALTVSADLSIPASGATAAFAMNTTLIFTNPNGTNGTPDGLAMAGTLNGIRGTLTATGGMFTFTRSSSGDAATVPAGTPWIDEYESVRRDWNQVLWVGRNNVTATPSDVAVYVAKMVAYQTSGDYLVLGVTNSTAEPSGSANYNTILGINAALASAYPNNYLDIRGWLIANGLGAVSLTPTATDTTAISEDRIPPSLLAADGLHLNANGYKAVAIAVKNWITTKGWV